MSTMWYADKKNSHLFQWIKLVKSKKKKRIRSHSLHHRTFSFDSDYEQDTEANQPDEKYKPKFENWN